MIVSRPDKDGQTLLNAVITQKRALPTIRRIVEVGANPMTLDGSSTTSGHLALRLDRKDIAWMFLTLWKLREDLGNVRSLQDSKNSVTWGTTHGSRMGGIVLNFILCKILLHIFRGKGDDSLYFALFPRLCFFPIIHFADT
jgi:hypothetical protein